MNRSARQRRFLVLRAVGMALVMGSLIGALWGMQRRLIYFPDAADVPPAADALPGARDVIVQTGDGLDLGAWFVPAVGHLSSAPMAVLVAPGNGGNRHDRVALASEMSRRGLAVLLMDYRGYGGNPGSPSEEGLAADALAAVTALEELGYPPHRLIYFGESLGTGVVAALQVRRPPAGMVLRSPFTELADVGAHHYPFLPVRALLRDRFPVVEHLSSSRVPVSVIYAAHDSVVPSVLSARVADTAPSLVERTVIEGADHNDPVMFGPRVADVVARLAREVSPR